MRANNYRFNGKELNEDFGLGWYDYGARWYDASIGRWNAVDLLAEEYMMISPYGYVANNPLIYTDPDGRRLIFYQYNQETEQYDRVSFDQLNQTTQEALHAFAQTKEGYIFLSDFAEAGDVIGDITFEKAGRLAEHDLTYSFDPNSEGGSAYPPQIDGRTADFSVRIGTKDKNDAEIAITLGHETFSHLDQYASQFADQCELGCFEDALIIRSEHQENNRQGVKDHERYLQGDKSHDRFRNFVE